MGGVCEAEEGRGESKVGEKKLFGVRATQNVWELRRKRYGKQAIYRV